MSGSGGGGGGGGGSSSDDCDINVQTPLNSPVASVIGTLSVGSVLEVEVETKGAVSVVLAKRAGKTAGSITTTHVEALIDCISKGNRYEAIVEKLKGGLCEVQVRRKS